MHEGHYPFENYFPKPLEPTMPCDLAGNIADRIRSLPNDYERLEMLRDYLVRASVDREILQERLRVLGLPNLIPALGSVS